MAEFAYHFLDVYLSSAFISESTPKMLYDFRVFSLLQLTFMDLFDNLSF